MTNAERKQLMVIIDHAAKIHRLLPYLGSVRNEEQKHAAFCDIVHTSHAMAQAFRFFDKEIEKEIDINLEQLLKDVEEVKQEAIKENQRQTDLGEVIGINLNDRNQVIDFLNSNEDIEHTNLLNIGEFISEYDKSEKAIADEIRRRLYGDNRPAKKPETFEEQENERMISESVEIIVKINQAIHYHNIRRNKDGRYY